MAESKDLLLLLGLLVGGGLVAYFLAKRDTSSLEAIKVSKYRIRESG